MLLAVGYAFFRRLVQKPARLERNGEALVILSLIAAIMITDFLFDGFRYALGASDGGGIADEASYAVVGPAIARGLAGLTAPMLHMGEHLFYWTQMATVLVFLVLLPTGEHFHIVTALPALYFAEGTASNRVPTVDIDKLMENADGDDVPVGVRTAARSALEGCA